MALADLETYARRLIAEQRQPPRQFDWRVISHALRDRQPVFVGLFGIAVMLAVIYGAISLGRTLFDITSFYAVLTLGTFGIAFFCSLWCLWLPLILIWRWYLGLWRGVLADAIIDELEIAPATFRAGERGEPGLRGRWTVSLPTRPFQERFYLDESWAAAVRVGSRVTVLAHPWRCTVLVHLGP